MNEEIRVRELCGVHRSVDSCVIEPDIGTLLSEILGQGVLVEARNISDCPDTLLSPERALVAGAGQARRLEFTAGRALARILLERIGIEDAPVLMYQNGAPMWPPGVVGSISHVSELCAVVLTQHDRVRGLGIDLEHNRSIDTSLFETICTPREREWLEGNPASSRGYLARLVFSAKESLYKCWYPLYRVQLDYQDVEIELKIPSQEFVARLRDDADIASFQGAALYGKYRIFRNWMVTGMVMEDY